MDIESIKCESVAADAPVDLRGFVGGKVKVCFAAAGDYTVSTASASDEDSCLPGEFVPYTTVDLCGDGKTETPLVLSVTEEEVACCFIVEPCGDFVSFSGDAVVSGFYAQKRRVLGVGCGPDVNPNDNLPA